MNYFPTVNPVHRVHVSVDQPGVLGQPWTDADADRGHGGALTGAWPSARVSPELGRRCGGRGTMVQNGEAATLGERAAQAGREGNRSGQRCSEARGGCSPFIVAGGVPGRGGRGG
jgi:hypothetical protein